MTDQEICDLQAEQLLRLRTAARTHDHPRAQIAVSHEVARIAQVPLGTDASALRLTPGPCPRPRVCAASASGASPSGLPFTACGRDWCGAAGMGKAQALVEGLVRDAE